MNLRSLCAAVALLTVGTANANSVILDNGNGTSTDYLANERIYLNDANYAGTTCFIDCTGLLTFDEAVQWADQLVFAGLSDWRLPTKDERVWLSEDLGPYTTFFNVQDYYWVTGTYGNELPGHGLLQSADGNVWQGLKTDFFYAFALHDAIDGTITPVPEPSTYALMLVGLGVVGWAARRRLN